MMSFEERQKRSCLRFPVFLLQVFSDPDNAGDIAYSPFWKTDGVFLYPDEARAFAKTHEYGIENRDWRVYSVPARGELTNRLV